MANSGHVVDQVKVLFTTPQLANSHFYIFHTPTHSAHKVT